MEIFKICEGLVKKSEWGVEGNLEIFGEVGRGEWEHPGQVAGGLHY